MELLGSSYWWECGKHLAEKIIARGLGRQKYAVNEMRSILLVRRGWNTVGGVPAKDFSVNL